jgi:TRAP-type mannitol/chloroaromatic compound transport system permease small subunit
MVSELRSWVQFLLTTYFLLLRVIILTYIISLSMHMVRTRGHDSYIGGGMLDYSIIGLLTPSISPNLYG